MINDGIISKETLFSVNISNMLSGFSKKRCECQFVESFILVTDFIEPMIQLCRGSTVQCRSRGAVGKGGGIIVTQVTVLVELRVGIGGVQRH